MGERTVDTYVMPWEAAEGSVEQLQLKSTYSVSATGKKEAVLSAWEAGRRFVV